MAAALGVALIGAALLVWWTAEQALPPAPKMQRSLGGAMYQCEGSCDPPAINGGTVAAVLVLAVMGGALVAAVVVDVVRRRQA